MYFSGLAVLIVNYRGSTGCGKDFLDALPGHVGSLDVKDCYVALQNSFNKFPWLDPKNVLLFGGSHGGFLVTHLSSQYPVSANNVFIILNNVILREKVVNLKPTNLKFFAMLHSLASFWMNPILSRSEFVGTNCSREYLYWFYVQITDFSSSSLI